MFTSIYCIAHDEHKARHILNALHQAGFRAEDISTLFPAKSTTSPEATVADNAVLMVQGNTLGWLVGIRMLEIPGLGTFVAAGPLMAALSDATSGGLTGPLRGQGLRAEEAQRYETHVRNGGLLISVHTEDHARSFKARDLLVEMGGDDAISAVHVSADPRRAKTEPMLRPLTPAPLPAIRHQRKPVSPLPGM